MSTEEKRQYFVFRITDNGEPFYGLWYTGESDGVVTEGGNVLLWRSAGRAHDHVRQRQWAMAPDEPAEFNLDYISALKKDKSVFRPNDTLHLWNLFVDIERSLDHAEFSHQDHSASELHAQLSAISLSHIIHTAQGQLTEPEIEKIVAVLSCGRAMLKEMRTVLD